jgi:hypothetical protein
MPRLEVEPAWIATDEHLEAFARIKASRPMWLVMFLGYKMPPDMPAILIGWRAVPLVHFSSGVLTVRDRGFEFAARDPSTNTMHYRGLRNDLTFEITREQIISVERDAGLKIARYFQPPFLRVRTTAQGWLSNFLVCAGGRGPSMKHIRERTDELYEALSGLRER